MFFFAAAADDDVVSQLSAKPHVSVKSVRSWCRVFTVCYLYSQYGCFLLARGWGYMQDEAVRRCSMQCMC